MEFGNGTNLTNWTLNSLGTGDGRSTAEKKVGQSSAKLTGSATASRYIGQLVQAKGKSGSPITLSGWANTKSPNQTGDFSLQATVVYTDGTEGKFTVPFDKTLLSEWQFVKKTFRALKDFSYVKIYANFNNQTGTVYFDNVKLEERAGTSSTTYTSDGNFVETETDALNQTSTYSTDVNGNLIGIISPKGNRTAFGYDYLDRLTSVTQVAPAGKTDIKTTYEYDKQGNLEHRIDSRGYITDYKYNAINQLSKKIDPLGKYINYDHYPNGNLRSVEKGKGTSVYSTHEFKYNNNDQIVEKRIDGNLISSYEYDNAGNLNSIQNNGQKYTFGYDSSNRLISASLVLVPNFHTMKKGCLFRNIL